MADMGQLASTVISCNSAWNNFGAIENKWASAHPAYLNSAARNTSADATVP